MRRAGRAKSKSPIPPAWRIKSFCGGVTELSGEVLKLGIYQLFFSYRFKDSASGANRLGLVLKSWQEVFPAEWTGFRLGKTGGAKIFPSVHVLFDANILGVLQTLLPLGQRQERLGEHPVAACTKNRGLHFMSSNPLIDPRPQKTELPANPGAGDLTAGHHALDLLHTKTQVFGYFYHRHH
jgi:hypothetical protein